jgi:2-isopropylmalate synthase/UPF0716 protein FxsA
MIYFLVYLFLEVLISVNISSYIGGLLTFIEIMFSALVGISILINFRTTLMENFSALSMQAIDLEQFQKLNIFTLMGAVLLILPGFFTDIIGVLLQFSLLTTLFVNRYHVKSQNTKQTNNTYQKDSDVIDVEIISDSTTIK